MKTVTVHQAKTHLSKLLIEVAEGVEIVISRGPIPAARLIPVSSPRRRQFGALKNEVKFDERFFDPLPDEELAAWGET